MVNNYCDETPMKISSIFADNMILQRNKLIRIFGEGKGIGKITIGTQTKTFVSTTDSWAVVFEPLPATTKPIVFKTDLSGVITEYKNVLVGDVYIASGQSNMALTLTAIGKADTVVENSLLRYNYRGENSWCEFSPQTINLATAIGTMFAQNITTALNNQIPIGIISASQGASRIEDWIHSDYCFCDKYDFKHTAHIDYFFYDYGHHELYRSIIMPIERFSIAGVLWYQGESNRGIGEAYRYLDMFKTLVRCWRTRMSDATLPFYTVQIMLYQSDGAVDGNGNEVDECNIRIAQGEAARTMDNVTVCTLLSLEDTVLASTGRLDIHPTNKQPIAKALANAALSTYYYPLGEYSDTPEYSGPIYKNVNIVKNTATISFSHTGEGLMLTDGETVSEFEICDTSGNWSPAKANLIDDKVIITMSDDKEIIAIRMGYRNRPSINLYNIIDGRRGYCASPFVWSNTNL